MKKYSDFAKDRNILDGDKLSILEVINREVLLIGYRLTDGKYKNKCLTLHIELEGIRYIIFTSSTILTEQVESYKGEIPYLTTIKKIDKYYTFT